MACTPTLPPTPFIVGVARSGTTLLRFMLERHRELAIPAETHFLPSLIPKSPTQPSIGSDEFVQKITACFTWADFGLTETAINNAVAVLKPFTVADGLRVFYRLCAESQGKTRWGDKTPPYAEHIAAISALLPEAYFIHLIRDGRAVTASRRHLAFGPGPDIVAQARDWGHKIREARRQAVACPRYMEIRYEDLVMNAETVLRAVCGELDLEYDPMMLDYQVAAATRLQEFRDWRRPAGEMFLEGDYRRSIHQRTRQPLDANRIHHWRHVLQPAEVAAFEAESGDLLTELGYPLVASSR